MHQGHSQTLKEGEEGSRVCVCERSNAKPGGGGGVTADRIWPIEKLDRFKQWGPVRSINWYLLLFCMVMRDFQFGGGGTCPPSLATALCI